MSAPEDPERPGRRDSIATLLPQRADASKPLRLHRAVYAAPPGQPRVRRATDVMLLASSLVALMGLIPAQPFGALERSLLRFLASFPSWLRPTWAFLVGLLVACLIADRARRPAALAQASCAGWSPSAGPECPSVRSAREWSEGSVARLA